MKNTLIVLLALTLCLTLLSGCFKSSPLKFDFSFEIEKDIFSRGETIQITATVTNVSGRTYRYQGCSGNDFIPRISLYCGTEDQTNKIPCDPIVLPTDVVEKKIKNGESGSNVYSFVIPADARLGKYSLALSYGENTKIFGDVLSILEITSQNESEEYTPNPTTFISSGGAGIHPLDFMLGVSYYTNGKIDSEDCGFGAERILSNLEKHFYRLPTLVFNGEIDVSVAENTKISKRIRVYVLGEESAKYTFETFDELSTLPAGEYLISYMEHITHETIVNELGECYKREDNENLFRLVIQ